MFLPQSEGFEARGIYHCQQFGRGNFVQDLDNILQFTYQLPTISLLALRGSSAYNKLAASKAYTFTSGLQAGTRAPVIARLVKRKYSSSSKICNDRNRYHEMKVQAWSTYRLWTETPPQAPDA